MDLCGSTQWLTLNVEFSINRASLEVYYSPPHLRFQGFPQFLTKKPEKWDCCQP